MYHTNWRKRIMNENELFNAFAADATLSHALSRRKFMRYAVEARLNGSLFDEERKGTLRSSGMNEREIENLFYVFEWVDDMLYAIDWK